MPLIEDDEDLVPLLRQASNEELEPLVRYIVEKGGPAAQIHRTLAFRQYSSTRNHRMYADEISAEIQKFGANTLWSQTLREGRGIKYRKILKKVAKRCGVRVGTEDGVAEVEERILVAVLSKAYEGMTTEQRQEMLETLRIHNVPGAGGPITVAALQTAIQSAGFAPYKLAVIVANGIATAMLGRGLAFATNAGLTKWLALFGGPVGWALDAMWSGMILAGPAYRVIIPCVVQVALIRQSMLHLKRQRRWQMLRKIGVAACVALALLLAVLAARHFIG